MSRVIVINEPRPCRFTGKKHFYNIDPATEFGEIEFLFKYDNFAPSDDPDRALSRADDALKNYREDDYIVWAGGDPFGMVVVGIALADKPTVNYLKWDKLLDADGKRAGGQYLPLTLHLGD